MRGRTAVARSRVERLSAFITVKQAAEELGIGVDLAYRLAHEYLHTNGESGLPCARLGRRLLVSRSGIESVVGSNLPTV